MQDFTLLVKAIENRFTCWDFEFFNFIEVNLIDELLRHAWDMHIPHDAEAALVAVGGYGRREQCIWSDVDIMVLTAEDVDSAAESGVSAFFTALWDIGLDIGHSVRTTADCRRQEEYRT